MSTIATPIHATAVRRSFARTVVVYWKEAKYEFLKLLRIPMYSASVLLFPTDVLCLVWSRFWQTTN